MKRFESTGLIRPQPSQHWVYAQLFPPATLPPVERAQLADRLLLESLAPEFSALRRRQPYFFVRFHEGGYHLRLRVLGRSQRCRQAVRRRMQELLLPALAQGSMLRFADYQPEIEKYCGEQGNRVAEQHFCDSSDVALQTLARSEGSRVLSALRLMQAALQAADLPEVEQALWCRAYYQYWWKAMGRQAQLAEEDEAFFLRHQARIEAQLKQAQPDESEILWRQSVRRSCAQLMPLEQRGLLVDPMRERDADHGRYAFPLTQLSMLPNFVHMLNNRLGVTVRQEMRLAHCLMRASGQQPERIAPNFQISLIPV